MEDIENQNPEDSFYFNKPNLMLRIKSTIIDSVVIILLMYIASLLLDFFEIQSGTVRGFLLVLILAYEPILVAIDRTFGQKLTGLRVRRYKELKENGDKFNITIFNSFLRYAVKLFFGWISLLTIHSSKYGQAIHDKIGRSIMTRES